MAALAGNENPVHSRHPGGAPDIADQGVDASLEVSDIAERSDVDGRDGLSGVGDAVVVMIEVDDVPAHRRTSERTRENLTRPDAGSGGVAYIEKQLELVPREIEKLGNDLASATDAAQKLRLKANLRQTESYLEELRQIKPALPTRTFDRTVTLNVGDREIRILLLGRGHTDGDVFIYLPQEKVVATGDALIDWMPFINDGFPEDWVRTLDALEKFEFTQIIPGHGGVMPKEHLTFFRGYLADLVAAVKMADADGASLDEMKKTLPDRLAGKYEQGMSKHPLGRYRDRIGLNIEIVYRKVVGKA